MAPIAINDDSFKSEVLEETSVPVLVDFWAPWCGPCKMLAPVIDAIAIKYEGKLKVCKLNTDEAAQTATDMQITGIPCCIVFKDGKEIDRIIGFKAQDAFEQSLAPHIG